MTGRFAPADNLGETMTVSQLARKLDELPPDALVVIRFCSLVFTDGEADPGDVTLHGEGGSVTLKVTDPLDCAIEVEDVEEKDGVVYLCTGHETIDEILNR